MENVALYLQLGGLALAVIALIWLIIAAFTQGIWWGLGTLFLTPFVGLVFAIRHWRKGLWPLLLGLIGVGAMATPAVYALLVPIDLGPRERVIDGKLRITLTGWDRDEYGVLKDKKDVVILEMANADVTDATLEHLRGLDRLEELDLTGSQVSDAGLGVIKELPRLHTLFLDRTQVTDEGVRNDLTPMESLRKLSLAGTKVSDEAARAWRKASKGRKVMR